jgi:hypothetical protein
MGHAAMDTGKMLLSFVAIVGAFHLARELAMGLGNLAQAPLERLWSLVLRTIMICQIGRQSKVKACAVTCHGSIDRLMIQKAGKVHVQLSERSTFDRYRFDAAFDGSRLGVLVCRAANPQAVAPQQLPPGLRQGERLGLGDLAQRGWTNLARGFPGFAVLHVLKETLIAFVNTHDEVLDSLRAKLTPPGIFGKLLELGNVGFQWVQRQILFIQAIVTATKSYRVVMDSSTNVN